MCAIIHFGTDGWRARVDDDFTADNVARIADAVGELWQKINPGKTVYIGFDTRPRAREFAELAAGVLRLTDWTQCSHLGLSRPPLLRGRWRMTVRPAVRSW